jgi:hypothetical protein
MNRSTVVVSLFVSVAFLGACQASPTPTPAPAPVSGTASPAAGSPPAPVPSGTVQEHAPPGTLSVLTFEPGKAITLLRRGQTSSFGTAGNGDMLPVPSPEGQRLALVSSPDSGVVAPGDLVVIAAGGQRHVLAHQVIGGGGNAPAWTPDGKAVIHGGVRYDVSGGGHAGAGLTGNPAYLTYSVGGATLAYATSSNSITVAPVGGGAKRVVDISKLAECNLRAACPFAVQAVSDDGRYVALGSGNTDPSNVTEAHLVLDTSSGRPVDLSAFGDVQHIWFTASGGAIVHTARDLRVVDAAWHVTGTFPAPGNGKLFYTA